MPAGLPDPTYQTLDKAADYVAYICMVLWAWRTPIRREATATFALRSVGQAGFFLTRDELWFFFFPNLLEPLFLVFASLRRLRGEAAAAMSYRRHRLVIWLVIVLYKLQDEWITHVSNVDRSAWLRGLLE